MAKFLSGHFFRVWRRFGMRSARHEGCPAGRVAPVHMDYVFTHIVKGKYSSLEDFILRKAVKWKRVNRNQ